MKVYLLWQSEEYECSYLVGVYSTMEKAQDVRQHSIETEDDPDYPKIYYIREEEVK